MTRLILFLFAWYTATNATKMEAAKEDVSLSTVRYSITSDIDADVTLRLLKGYDGPTPDGTPDGLHPATIEGTGDNAHFVSKYAVQTGTSGGDPVYTYYPYAIGENEDQFLIYEVVVKTSTTAQGYTDQEKADLLAGSSVVTTLQLNQDDAGQTVTNSKAAGLILAYDADNAISASSDYPFSGSSTNTAVELTNTGLMDTNGQTVAYVFVYAEGENGSGQDAVDATILCAFNVTVTGQARSNG